MTETPMTCHLHNLEDGEILKLAKGFYKESDRLYIETTESGHDGTWERKSDFKRFLNKIESHDTKAIQNFIVGKNKKADFGFCTVEKVSIKFSNDGLKITFKEPIKVYFGEVGNKIITEEVNSLQGKLMYDFYHFRNNDEIGIELFIEEVEFLS